MHPRSRNKPAPSASYRSSGGREARKPHRSAAANEDTALSLRQREIGGRLGDANMRRAGKLKAAAYHRALERGDHWDTAILNAIEHPVPHLRMPQAFGCIVLGQFREVQAGREMIANAMNNDGADTFR